MGIRVPNRQLCLPSELSVKNSDLDKFVSVTQEAVESHAFGAAATLQTARRLIQQACPLYQPSQLTENEIYCRSGEIDGTPFRSQLCNSCRVGQFSKTGLFAGEVVSIAVLTSIEV